MQFMLIKCQETGNLWYNTVDVKSIKKKEKEK